MDTAYTFVHANNIIESFRNEELIHFNIGDIYISHDDIAYYIINIKRVLDGRIDKVTHLFILEEVPEEDQIVEILTTI